MLGNMPFLFWLSLISFVTSWVGEHNDSPVPAAAYADSNSPIISSS